MGRTSFAPGELINAAVLDHDHIIQLHDIEGVGSEDAPTGGEVLGLAFTQDSWVGVACLYPEQPRPLKQPLPLPGLAIIRFTAESCSQPETVIPEAAPAGPVWLFPHENTVDMFWPEIHHLKPDVLFALADSDRLGLFHSRMQDEKWQPKRLVFKGSGILESYVEGDHLVVEKAANRYDFFFDRSRVGGDPQKEHLVQVSDILRNRNERLWNILEHATSSTWTITGDRLLLLGELSRDARSRLVEMRQEEKSWGSPRTVFEPGRCDYASFAATSFGQGSEDSSIAIWRNKNGQMVYIIRKGLDWGRPEVTDLDIGTRNWIVAVAEGFYLVTHMNRNLYWSYLKLQREAARKKGRE